MGVRPRVLKEETMPDPHPVPDEDPEKHIGEPVPDPWDEADDGAGHGDRWVRVEPDAD